LLPKEISAHRQKWQSPCPKILIIIDMMLPEHKPLKTMFIVW
jgi:hypothetical protein